MVVKTALPKVSRMGVGCAPIMNVPSSRSITLGYSYIMG